MPLSNVEVLVDEEEDNEQNERDHDNKKKKKTTTRKGTKGDRFLIASVSKAKKRFVSKITRKPFSSNMSSSSQPSSGFWKKVCFCGIGSSPNTLQWSCSSTSDPENENFTSQMFRVMLQTNDFFSKDCNPHL